MVRYVEEYQKCGIPIYAMTIQNEPLLEINYPSCAMTGTQEAKIAKAIKAELAKSTVLKDNEKKLNYGRLIIILMVLINLWLISLKKLVIN